MSESCPDALVRNSVHPCIARAPLPANRLWKGGTPGKSVLRGSRRNAASGGCFRPDLHRRARAALLCFGWQWSGAGIEARRAPLGCTLNSRVALHRVRRVIQSTKTRRRAGSEAHRPPLIVRLTMTTRYQARCRRVPSFCLVAISRPEQNMDCLAQNTRQEVHAALQHG